MNGMLGLLFGYGDDRPMASIRQPEVPLLRCEADSDAGHLEHAPGGNTVHTQGQDQRAEKVSFGRRGSRWPFRSTDPRFGEGKDGDRAGEGQE